MGHGPIVFHLPQALVDEIRATAKSDLAFKQLELDLHRSASSGTAADSLPLQYANGSMSTHGMQELDMQPSHSIVHNVPVRK